MRRLAIVGSVLAVFTLIGCTGDAGDSSRRQPGWASIRFDGIPLGWGGGDAYPRIACSRESDSGGPSLIEGRDRWCCGAVGGDWIPRDGGMKASLRLEMPPSQEGVASAQFSIGSAVYRSDTATKVEPGWLEGRAVFRDVPLVSGDPYEGKRRLKRLVVEWRCRRPG